MKTSSANILLSTALLAFALMLVIPYTNLEAMELVLLHFPGIDKFVHFLQHFFIVLGVYFLLGKTSYGTTHNKKVTVAITVSVVFSILDESLQLKSAARSFEVADIAANTLGALSGAMAVSFSRIKPLLWYTGMVILLFSAAGIISQSYLKTAPYYSGMKLEKNGKFVQAREQYSRALAAGSTHAGLLDAIAWLDLVYLDGDPAKALDFTKKAVAQNSRNGNYLDTHGLALLKNGRPEEALFFLEKAYTIDPDIYTIHFHLAMAYRSLGQNDKAVEQFKKQIHKTPDQHYGRQARIELDNMKAGKGK
jgi:tetratricopeptide (TPR) repeat protein